MATHSKIEWTETTWNPVTGCTKISPGCKNCYAEQMAKRLKLMGSDKYRNEFKLTIHPDALEEPLKWRKPKMIFVNSMSDLFHEHVPESFILQVFAVMNQATQHTFQVLTKRPERLLELDKKITWTSNIWMGVSVENAKYIYRIDKLSVSSARTKFLSLEPLLGPLDDLPLKDIDWVIVGGESGRKARPMQSEWVESIKVQCQESGVAFFFKQWGAFGPDGKRRSKKANGRTLDDKVWNEFPEMAV